MKDFKWPNLPSANQNVLWRTLAKSKAEFKRTNLKPHLIWWEWIKNVGQAKIHCHNTFSDVPHGVRLWSHG